MEPSFQAALSVSEGPIRLQEVRERREVEEVVQRRLEHRRRAGQERPRLPELDGVVRRAADLAVVPVLIGRAAAGTVPFHVAVREEEPFLRVVELLHLLRKDVAFSRRRS